jgi:hypothetical protein
MKLIAVSIKTNTLNAYAESLLCDCFTHDLSGFLISGVLGNWSRKPFVLVLAETSVAPAASSII